MTATFMLWVLHPTSSPSPTSSNTLFIIIGVVAAVVIIAAVVFLMFQKRLNIETV